MAAMPIYGKKQSNDFFSRTTVPIRLIFCMKHMGWGTLLYKIAKIIPVRIINRPWVGGLKLEKYNAKFRIHESFELDS